VTKASVQQAQQVITALHKQLGERAQQLLRSHQHYVPLVQQVIDQTTRRVLLDEQVPASEKLVSLFEPHTAIIRKGKPGKPTEFGRVVWLSESLIGNSYACGTLLACDTACECTRAEI